MAGEPTKDQQLFDLILGNALDMLRVSAYERAQIFAKLKAMESQMTELLSDFNTQTSDTTRVERFLSKVSDYIDDSYSDIAEQLDLPGVAKYVIDHTKDSLDIVLGKDVKKPPRSYAKSVDSDVLIQGSPAKDWWKGQSVDLQNKFARQVRMGMSAGETNQQIVSRIVGKGGVGGIMNATRANAAALVQTSVQTVANDARRRTFQENSDLIKGVRQVSTLDSHTTIICVAYSGAEWDLDYKPINGNTLPFNNGTPRHWNCRSVEIPITVTFRDLGIDIDEPTSTRASSSGQIPDSTTFEDYLKRMGTAYENEVLGKGRADLWRAGKITLRDLVDGAGNPISLTALQEKVQAKDNIEGLFSRIAQPDGGFTYQPLSAKQPTEGYALSPFPQLSFAKKADDFTANDLTDYIVSNADQFKQADRFIGGWHDPNSGQVFLDVSIVTNSEEEARKLALEYDQIAYFDLAKGQSVEVNANATSGGVSQK